jgi:hypothetical protein
MKLGTDNRKQTILASALGLVALGACVYIYEQIFDVGGSSSAPAPVVVVAPVPPGQNSGSKPRTVAPVVSAASLDPQLHMEAMLVTESVEYAGTGRNIFSMTTAPLVTNIPKPIAPARIDLQAARPQPPAPPTTCPPSCPPIPLKFFGTITSNGTRQAFLLNGTEDVFPASVGDVVMRRYKVLAISANSIQIEDMPTGDKQNLPLLAN